MLDLFRKIRIRKLTQQATAFLNQVYIPESKPKQKPEAEPKHEYKSKNPKVLKKQKKQQNLGREKFLVNADKTPDTTIRHSAVDEILPQDTFCRHSKCDEEIPSQNKAVRYSERVNYSLSSGLDNDLFGDNYDTDRISGIMRSKDMFPSDRIGSLIEKNLNVTFSGKLKEIIRRLNLRDADVYRAAQIDRRLFSKIMSDNEFHPSKDTALSLVFATRLTLDDAKDLLSRAGYTLSRSSKRDVILEYFIREGIHNLTDINIVLDDLKEKPIGRQ